MIAGAVAAAILIMVAAFSLSHGATIPVGNAQGLDVRVDFQGYKAMANGTFVYELKQVLSYRVTVTNRTPISLNQMEIQSMLQADHGRMPGAPFSPVYRTSLAPGQSYQFDVTYEPGQAPAKIDSRLLVSAKYVQRGAYKSDTLLCPTPLRFE
jgi:hypothetical protein